MKLILRYQNGMSVIINDDALIGCTQYHGVAGQPFGLDHPLDFLPLPVGYATRLANIARHHGVRTVRELIAVPFSQFRNWRGVGIGLARETVAVLARAGFVMGSGGDILTPPQTNLLDLLEEDPGGGQVPAVNPDVTIQPDEEPPDV